MAAGMNCGSGRLGILFLAIIFPTETLPTPCHRPPGRSLPRLVITLDRGQDQNDGGRMSYGGGRLVFGVLGILFLAIFFPAETLPF